MAFWDKNTLVIERCGPQGRFREERSIDDQGILVFKLTGLEAGDVRCVLLERDDGKVLGWDGMKPEITPGVLEDLRTAKHDPFVQGFSLALGWLVVNMICFFVSFLRSAVMVMIG